MKMVFTTKASQGPRSVFEIACTSVPAVKFPPVMVESDREEIVQSRPAQTAVALLLSSPSHMFPTGSRVNRLHLPGTKEKLEALLPLGSATMLPTFLSF